MCKEQTADAAHTLNRSVVDDPPPRGLLAFIILKGLMCEKKKPPSIRHRPLSTTARRSGLPNAIPGAHSHPAL